VPDPVPLEPPGEGVTPFVYASTLVVSGGAEAVGGATGGRTEGGRVGRGREPVSPAESPLNRQLSGLVRALFGAAMLFCLTVLLVYGFGRNDWKGGLLAGLTLAISVLPEECPVVIA